MAVLRFAPATLISPNLVATAYLFCFDLCVFASVIAILCLGERLSPILSERDAGPEQTPERVNDSCPHGKQSAPVGIIICVV